MQTRHYNLFPCFQRIPGYSSAMNLEKSFRQCFFFLVCEVWSTSTCLFGFFPGRMSCFFWIILTPALVFFRWGPRSLGAAWAIMQVKPGLLRWIYWLICSLDRLPGLVCTVETTLVLAWWIKRWWLFWIMSMLMQLRECFDQKFVYFTGV